MNIDQLYEALISQDFEGAKKALEQGAQVDEFNPLTKSTLFFHFLVNGKRTQAEWLANNGADVNALNGNEENVLFALIERDKKADFDYALSLGVKVNQSSITGVTPLIMACLRPKSMEYAKPLIEAGANINAVSHARSTPLLASIAEAKTEMVKYLLELGADATVIDEEGHSTVYNAVLAQAHEGIRNGKLLRLILNSKQPIDLNRADRGGSPPLAMACESQDLVSVIMLLRAGANANVQSSNKFQSGLTPLMLAAYLDDGGEGALVQEVLDAGAKASVRDHHGRNAMFYAINKGIDGKKIVLEKLIAAGADPEIPLDATALSPLHTVIAGYVEPIDEDTMKPLPGTSKAEVVKTLIDMGFPTLPRAFKVKDESYAPDRVAPPLIFALYFEEEEVAKVIMERGQPLTDLDEEGFSVAHYVSRVIDQTQEEEKATQLFDQKYKQLKKQIQTLKKGLTENDEHVQNNTHAKDQYGREIPHMTAKQVEGYQKKVLKIQEALAEMEAQIHQQKQARKEKVAAATVFLTQYGMDWNIRGRDGITPIMRFARNLQSGVVIGQLVKHHGADINALDDRGFHVADYAMQALNGPVLQNVLTHLERSTEGFKPVEKLLVNAVYASPEIEHEDGSSFVRRGIFLSILKTLPRHPQLLDGKDEEGNTALMVAAATGQEDVVEILLQMGANPNIQNNNGETALMLAVGEKQTDIIRMILQKDPDPLLKNNDGLTVMELGPAYSDPGVKKALATKDDLVMKPIDDLDEDIKEQWEEAKQLWSTLVEPGQATIKRSKKIGF